ncbi:MAG: hypothetical protein JRI96_14685, partial [Deltaproteobacteria bacterium]|nr:hypothetical protein [Deltaproteobacteria bacterium]
LKFVRGRRRGGRGSRRGTAKGIAGIEVLGLLAIAWVGILSKWALGIIVLTGIVYLVVWARRRYLEFSLGMPADERMKLKDFLMILFRTGPPCQRVFYYKAKTLILDSTGVTPVETIELDGNSEKKVGGKDFRIHLDLFNMQKALIVGLAEKYYYLIRWADIPYDETDDTARLLIRELRKVPEKYRTKIFVKTMPGEAIFSLTPKQWILHSDDKNEYNVKLAGRFRVYSTQYQGKVNILRFFNASGEPRTVSVHSARQIVVTPKEAKEKPEIPLGREPRAAGKLLRLCLLPFRFLCILFKPELWAYVLVSLGRKINIFRKAFLYVVLGAILGFAPVKCYLSCKQVKENVLGVPRIVRLDKEEKSKHIRWRDLTRKKVLSSQDFSFPLYQSLSLASGQQRESIIAVTAVDSRPKEGPRGTVRLNIVTQDLEGNYERETKYIPPEGALRFEEIQDFLFGDDLTERQNQIILLYTFFQMTLWGFIFAGSAFCAWGIWNFHQKRAEERARLGIMEKAAPFDVLRRVTLGDKAATDNLYMHTVTGTEQVDTVREFLGAGFTEDGRSIREMRDDERDEEKKKKRRRLEQDYGTDFRDIDRIARQGDFSKEEGDNRKPPRNKGIAELTTLGLLAVAGAGVFSKPAAIVFIAVLAAVFLGGISLTIAGLIRRHPAEAEQENEQDDSGLVVKTDAGPFSVDIPHQEENAMAIWPTYLFPATLKSFLALNIPQIILMDADVGQACSLVSQVSLAVQDMEYYREGFSPNTEYLVTAGGWRSKDLPIMSGKNIDSIRQVERFSWDNQSKDLVENSFNSKTFVLLRHEHGRVIMERAEKVSPEEFHKYHYSDSCFNRCFRKEKGVIGLWLVDESGFKDKKQLPLITIVNCRDFSMSFFCKKEIYPGYSDEQILERELAIDREVAEFARRRGKDFLLRLDLHDFMPLSLGGNVYRLSHWLGKQGPIFRKAKEVFPEVVYLADEDRNRVDSSVLALSSEVHAPVIYAGPQGAIFGPKADSLSSDPSQKHAEGFTLSEVALAVICLGFVMLTVGAGILTSWIGGAFIALSGLVLLIVVARRYIRLSFLLKTMGRIPKNKITWWGVLRAFRGGPLSWDNTTKGAKRRMLKKLARALNKEPGALTAHDFSKKIAVFGNKSLWGLIEWAKREFNCSSNKKALEELKVYLNIEQSSSFVTQDVNKSNILQLFREGRLSWKRTTKKAKLYMVKKLAKALNKKAGALTTADFNEKVTVFGGKGLSSLLSWAKKEFSCSTYTEALRQLKGYLRIKDLVEIKPSLNLSYEDWAETGKILVDYPGFSELPDTIPQILDIKLKDKDTDNLARNAQSGNRASYLVLSSLTERLVAYCAQKSGRYFGVPIDKGMDKAYTNVLNVCIARFNGKAAFRRYLYKSLRLKMLRLCKQKTKPPKTLITSEKDPEQRLGPDEVSEQEVSFKQYRSRRVKIVALSDYEREELFVLLQAVLRVYGRDLLIFRERELTDEPKTLDALAKEHDLTRERIRQIVKDIWVRIDRMSRLRNAFADAGFDIDSKVKTTRRMAGGFYIVGLHNESGRRAAFVSSPYILCMLLVIQSALLVVHPLRQYIVTRIENWLPASPVTVVFMAVLAAVFLISLLVCVYWLAVFCYRLRPKGVLSILEGWQRLREAAFPLPRCEALRGVAATDDGPEYSRGGSPERKRGAGALPRKEPPAQRGKSAAAASNATLPVEPVMLHRQGGFFDVRWQGIVVCAFACLGVSALDNEMIIFAILFLPVTCFTLLSMVVVHRFGHFITAKKLGAKGVKWRKLIWFKIDLGIHFDEEDPHREEKELKVAVTAVKVNIIFTIAFGFLFIIVHLITQSIYKYYLLAFFFGHLFIAFGDKVFCATRDAMKISRLSRNRAALRRNPKDTLSAEQIYEWYKDMRLGEHAKELYESGVSHIEIKNRLKNLIRARFIKLLSEIPEGSVKFLGAGTTFIAFEIADTGLVIKIPILGTEYFGYIEKNLRETRLKFGDRLAGTVEYIDNIKINLSKFDTGAKRFLLERIGKVDNKFSTGILDKLDASGELSEYFREKLQMAPRAENRR